MNNSLSKRFPSISLVKIKKSIVGMPEYIIRSLRRNYRTFIIIMISLVIGMIGEFVFNIPLLLGSDGRGLEYLELEQAELTNFELVDGQLILSGGAPSISINIDKQFVQKLRYSYSYASELHSVITYVTYDYFGGAEEVTFYDNNNIIFSESVSNFGKTISRITISFPEVSEGLVIKEISIDNTLNFSRVRYLFVCIAALIVLIFIVYRDFIIGKVERVFLTLSLLLGCLMLIALPSHKVGWDEEIHFSRAYSLSFLMTLNKQSVAYPVIDDVMNVTMANWPFSVAQTEEEVQQEKWYLNTHGKYTADEETPEGYFKNLTLDGLAAVGSLSQAFMITVGRIIGVPFTTLYAMGRLGNLLLYSIVIFFAIKHIKVGKKILLVIALMPTPMLQAVTYSYDATVIAFAILGFAYIVNELIDKETKISYKNYAVFVISMIIASCPKAIYIPLILLGLLLPASKFKDKKTMYIMKGIILLVFLGMMFTFVIPALLTESGGGDPRGGDTDAGKQLSLIFSYPLGYAKLLLKSLKETMFSYTVGSSVVGMVGHIGTSSCATLSTILLVGVTITDTAKETYVKIGARYKLAMGVIIFGIMCLIWTALYLSFTPVGHTQILGVQGRYYLPLLLPIFLIFNNNKIVNNASQRAYNTVIYGTSSFILLQTIYELLIVNRF